MYTTATSVKHCFTEGELSHRGTTPFGVTSIIIGILMLIVWIIVITSLDSVNTNTPALVHFLFIIIIANYFMLAVFAFGYKSHISRITTEPLYNYYPAPNQTTVYTTNPYQQSSYYSQQASPTTPAAAPVSQNVATAKTHLCPNCNCPVAKDQVFCGQCGSSLK